MGVSFVLVAIALWLLLDRGNNTLDSVAFCVVLLVASIPIAMPVVSTSTMALGSRALSAKGAIVTRLASIEEVAGMTMLCSDKTGTLTKNIMIIEDDKPCFSKAHVDAGDKSGIDPILLHAVLAADFANPPEDALDTLCLFAFDGSKGVAEGAWLATQQEPPEGWGIEAGSAMPWPPPKLDQAVNSMYKLVKHIPFSPVTKKTESTILNKTTNKYFKVSKGAPHVILDMSEGNNSKPVPPGGPFNCAEVFDGMNICPTLHDAATLVVDSYADKGTRCLAVCVTEEMDLEKLPPSEPDKRWSYLGVITFIDPPREDTADTIAKAIELSVKVKMITGDQIKIGKNMATTIGLGDDIQLWNGPDLLTDDKGNPIIPKNLGSQMGPSIEACDGFAQVYPEHKFLIVEALKQRGFSVGMTGDGVNDAPALKVANIGVAVQGATTAAQAASDIVLTEEGLGTIVLAIVEARKIFQRLRNYVVYRVACTIQLLLFFFIGVVLIKLSAYYPSGEDCHGHKSPHDCGLIKIPHELHNSSIGASVYELPSAGLRLDYKETVIGEGKCKINYKSWKPDYLVNGWVGKGCDSVANFEECKWTQYHPTTCNFLENVDPKGARPTGITEACCEIPGQFQLPVAAIVLITILNDGTIISIAYDFVESSMTPESWRLCVPLGHPLSSQ
jgi:H+-transporting ATPase